MHRPCATTHVYQPTLSRAAAVYITDMMNHAIRRIAVRSTCPGPQQLTRPPTAPSSPSACSGRPHWAQRSALAAWTPKRGCGNAPGPAKRCQVPLLTLSGMNTRSREVDTIWSGRSSSQAESSTVLIGGVMTYQLGNASGVWSPTAVAVWDASTRERCGRARAMSQLAHLFEGGRQPRGRARAVHGEGRRPSDGRLRRESAGADGQQCERGGTHGAFLPPPSLQSSNVSTSGLPTSPVRRDKGILHPPNDDPPATA